MQTPEGLLVRYGPFLSEDAARDVKKRMCRERHISGDGPFKVRNNWRGYFVIEDLS